MVIQHNISGMNSNRQLNITTGVRAKSSEKLSSGYKINRSADDAAGLAIQEKTGFDCNGKTEDEIAKDMERDFFMSADEALAYGIVDKVMPSRASEAK